MLALTAAACASAPPGPAEQLLTAAELSRSGGCGDVFIFATNADDTLALTVNWAQVASHAQAAGQLSETISLPEPEVGVALQIGRFLSDGFCTDILRPDRPVLLAELPATAGTLKITVTPAANAEPFMPISQATLELTDVVFELPLEDSVEIWRIPSLELRDIQVGWMAG